jgi:hypothetical protein
MPNTARRGGEWAALKVPFVLKLTFERAFCNITNVFVLLQSPLDCVVSTWSANAHFAVCLVRFLQRGAGKNFCAARHCGKSRAAVRCICVLSKLGGGPDGA